ncbi:leucine-rich repeat-containing protein 9 [Anabrus simplex]|uniref:leucine-rich repeat-containing protein 9 n=1 Tax=Anabrus simplex TaxID=316456 RepID=UPI0035A26B56
MYGECPVAQICNYRPFMVYHLPQVQNLDHYQIESEERDKVKDFYNTKSTFYRVQYRHSLAAFYKAKKEKMKEHYSMLNTFRGHLYAYAVKKKELSNLSGKAKAVEQKELAMKVQHLNVKVSQWKEQMENWKRKHSDDIQRRRWQLSLELRTAGNLVLIEHSGNSDLRAASQNLLEKYICDIIYRKLHIVGVKVVQVMELHNKGLEIASKAMSWNKHQKENALMLVMNPEGVNPSSAWPYHVFEEGFMEFNVRIRKELN